MLTAAPALLRVVSPEDDVTLPSAKVIVLGGLVMSGGVGAFFVDFCMRKAQQNAKRKRVFARSVRAYLNEFDDELAQEMTKHKDLQIVGNTGSLTLKDRLPSTEGDILPYCLTHSFRLQAEDPDEDLIEYKTIHLLKDGAEKKLVVRRGATEEHVRHGIMRVLKLPQSSTFTVMRENHLAGISHEQLIDGGVYTITLIIDVRLRRQSMIIKATEARSFRYSVGIDWKEVSNMLRKAIDYGESESIKSQLRLLLAMHLMERLDSFAKDPKNEMYTIGKAVDDIEKDLTYLAEMLGTTKEAALSPCKTSPGEMTVKELVTNLSRHIKERNRTGLSDLTELLRRSYLRKENVIRNTLSFVFSAAAGLMQPSVSALQIRLAKDVATAETSTNLSSLRDVLFWTISYTIITNILAQASKAIHTQQTATTVQILRRKAAYLMSRADKAFLDTHEVEDILTTLEGDIGNIGLLLRYSRGWLIDFSRIVGSLRMIVSALHEEGPGVVAGVMVGVGMGHILGKLKVWVSRQLDHIPEEEDDVQEFIPGTRVKYIGKDLQTASGATLENGDEGFVTALEPRFVTCQFAAGALDMTEDVIEALDGGNPAAGVGVPNIDFDEVWEEEPFLVARMWGREVEEVEAALATKDLQIRKQSEFIFVPGVLSDVVDAFRDSAPKIIMLLVAVGLCNLLVDETGVVQSIGSRLVLLESEMTTAMLCGKKIHREVRALLHDSFVGARRTIYLLDYRPTIDNSTGGGLTPDPSSIKGLIEFQNVTFAYPTTPTKPVLRDISFTIEPGTHVAIVGASGCGKSSIFTLLTRLYDPQKGRILLDGVDIKEYDVRYLRKWLINTAVQDPYMFEASLQYNIKYGRPKATREEVQRVLEYACFDKVIDRLREKLFTVLGNGMRLSGGEQKRLGLARTLLGKSKVVLLDEPTAGLDSTTESEVKRNLRQYRERTGTTMITISHNLSLTQDCDHILVLGSPEGLSAGRIIAQGLHDDLIRSCREYSNFARTQQVRSNTSSELSPNDLDVGRFASSETDSIPSPCNS